MGDDGADRDDTVLGEDDGASSDDAFSVLADPTARTVLAYLREVGSADVDELADVLAGTEAAETGGVSRPDDRQRLLVRLHHVILPKLEAVDYVAVDDGTVRPTGVPEAVYDLIDSEG